MENTPKRSKQVIQLIWQIGKIGILIGVPIFLVLAPKDYFDHGTPISLFQRIGVDGYYSKGLTRGVMHLIHLDFKTAADFNKLSFVVFPIIAILWAGALWKELKNLRKRFTPAPSPDQTTPQNEEKPD